MGMTKVKTPGAKPRPYAKECYFCKIQTAIPAKMIERGLRNIPKVQWKCEECNIPLCLETCFKMWHESEDPHNYQKNLNVSQVIFLYKIINCKIYIEILNKSQKYLL